MAIKISKILLFLFVFVLTTFYLDPARGQKKDIIDSLNGMIELNMIFFKDAEDEEIIKSAREDLIYNFKDPGSAIFRNEKIIHSEIGIYVCGEVNAVNSYGAYVGFLPYFSAGISSYTMTNEDRSVGSIAVMHFCSL